MLVDAASNTLYAHNDFNTGAGPWLRWFPYPTSNTFMCAYVHIPTVDNGGYVYYQGGANNKSSGTIYLGLHLFGGHPEARRLCVSARRSPWETSPRDMLPSSVRKLSV